MNTDSPKPVHPHDVGLPAPVVRQRRKARRVARFMLVIAVLTAAVGWGVFGQSVFSAVRVQEQSPYRAIFAYAFLVASSATLILGLWYLLLAQVRRIARMVEPGHDEALPDAAPVGPRCPNCGWPHDPPDRFCRHCGKPLGTTIMPRSPADR